MRILLLTPRLPWPPLDGGRIAMARLAESLAHAGAEVEILSLRPKKDRDRAGAGPASIPITTVDVDTSRLLGPALRSATSELPYIVARFVSPEMQAALREALHRFAPDVVQIESPFLLPYLETVRAASKARVVLRSLNVEFRIWDELARQERNPLRRLALHRVATSLRRYEVGTLNAPDAIVPISPADADDFRALGCTRPTYVVPCGVILPAPIESEPIANTVGFIGSLDFRPNQQAVQWIVDELWPLVIARMPEARLEVAGSSPPAWLVEQAIAKGIEIRSDIADAEGFVRRLAVFIAPLFAGGGMRIKVLEAMALGKAIVATPLGAGGIEARHEHDLLIASDASSFADDVVRLLCDCELATRIGENARVTVAAHYDSDTLARGLVSFYESL